MTKLGAVWDSGGADVVLTPCDASGKTYTVSGKGTKEPENPADGQLFLKVNNIQKPYSSESVLEVYNEASGNWSAIELKWCRIEAGGIGKDFAVWDTVTVSGVEDGDDLHWKELKGDRIVTARGDDWVQVQAEPGRRLFLRDPDQGPGDAPLDRASTAKARRWKGTPMPSGWNAGCRT